MDNHLHHNTFMISALRLAQEAYDVGEVPVGCVIVHRHSGTIVSHGRNRTNEYRNATRHAELEAITSFLKESNQPVVWSDYCLYVTVEPCIMCGALLRDLQFHHVYYGCANERFGGTGSILSIHTEPVEFNGKTWKELSCIGGCMRKEAILLLRKFYLRENDHAPNPKKKKNRVFKTEILPPKPHETYQEADM